MGYIVAVGLVDDVLRQVLAVEVSTREVHRDGYGWTPLIKEPALQDANLLDDIVIEGDDKAVLLKDGYKGVRSYDAALRMDPAHQGLSTGKAIFGDAVKWLQEDLELPKVERLAHFVDDRLLLEQFLSQGVGVVGERLLVVPLCRIERHVCTITHQGDSHGGVYYLVDTKDKTDMHFHGVRIEFFFHQLGKKGCIEAFFGNAEGELV